MDSAAPTDNLVRAITTDEAVHLRADDGEDGRTLYGHFAVFNRWTEIDSWVEGQFMERIAPGAFERTIGENRSRIKVLFDHGFDPQLGNKPLGPIDELKEDSTGVYYEVPLIDTDYNDRFVLPAARAGLLGASFRFRVAAEDWATPARSTKDNPDKLDERTITDLDLYEFGPVTFPAYQDATAGVRSMTDTFVDRLLRDPIVLARFADRVGGGIATRLLEALPPTAQTRTELPPTAQPTQDTGTSADGQERKPHTLAERQRQARLIELERLGIRPKE